NPRVENGSGRGGFAAGDPAGEVTEVVDGVKQIARADNHRDPMLAGAWKELQRRGAGTRGFSFGPYLAMVADFPRESGIDWQVIGGGAELDYFGDAERPAWTAGLVGGPFAA